MAKKKSAQNKAQNSARKAGSATKKASARTKASIKKVAGKKVAVKKEAGKTATTKTTTSKKPAAAAAKRSASPRTATLGRPTLTADEPLYLAFKEDYHARQIFEFLRVQTVRELEQHAPKEIFERLTKPVRESVDRIRRFLAERNRCLAGGEEFALAHKQRVEAQEGLARNS
jgi:hypothetical protein